MKNNPLLLFFCLLVIGSCTNAEQKQLEQLQNEVLAVHDEVMPQMGTLNELKTSLMEKNEMLKVSEDSTVIDQVILNDMLITKLDQSHEGMMAWMRQFERIDEQAEVAENRQYLEDQMQMIQQVKIDMDQAIQSAEQALTE